MRKHWAVWTLKIQIWLVDGGSPDDVIKSYAVAETKSRVKQCNPSVNRTCWTLVMAKVHLLQGGKPNPVPCSNTRSPGRRPSSSHFHQMRSPWWPLGSAADWALRWTPPHNLLSPQGPCQQQVTDGFLLFSWLQEPCTQQFQLHSLHRNSGCIDKNL